MFGYSTYCELPYSTLTVEIRYVNGDILYFTGTIDQILNADYLIDQILNSELVSDTNSVFQLTIKQNESLILNINQNQEKTLI